MAKAMHNNDSSTITIIWVRAVVQWALNARGVPEFDPCVHYGSQSPARSNQY